MVIKMKLEWQWDDDDDVGGCKVDRGDGDGGRDKGAVCAHVQGHHHHDDDNGDDHDEHADAGDDNGDHDDNGKCWLSTSTRVWGRWAQNMRRKQKGLSAQIIISVICK